MTTRTLAAVAVAATLAAAAAVPSAASAAKGWKLPTFSTEQSGLKVSSSGKRCGKSKFGTWKFRGRMSAEGKYADIRWKVTVSKDGKAHPLTAVRVSGTAPESGQAGIKSSLSAQSVRYAAGPPRLETLASNGELSATRQFQPKRTKGC